MTNRESSVSTLPSRVRAALLPLLLLLLLGLAWSPGLDGPFYMDDYSSIPENPTIRELWSLDTVRPPATAGETVSSRPVLNLSFAVNYAFHGLDPRGFRLTNLLFHFASALVLYGLVRRLAIALPGRSAAASGSERNVAAGLALAVSLLWAVHPLTTAAVSYIVQRAESLSAFFYLLTAYTFVRAATAPFHQRHWTVACVVFFLLGFGTKETVVTAPFVLLLLDRTFFAESFREAWHQRRGLYLSLAVVGLVWLLYVFMTNPTRGGSVSVASDVSPWHYLLTQAQAIPHYVRLAVWPTGLVFDHGTPVVRNVSEVALPLLLLVALIILCLVGVVRRGRRAAVLGLTFFLLLAPSSSVLPVATQTMAEHRMYLPLVPLLVLLVGGIERALRRHAPRFAHATLLGLAAAALIATTFARNQLYGSEIALWGDTVTKRPENPRAHYNLGRALWQAGRSGEARYHLDRALDLQPTHAYAHGLLGLLHLQGAEWDAALSHLQTALAADPNLADARVNLGRVYVELGRTPEAMEQFERALRMDPTTTDVRIALAALQIDHHQPATALSLLESALRQEPQAAVAHYQLGRALQRLGRREEAARALREAARLQPDLPEVYGLLAQTLVDLGDLAGAQQAYEQALYYQPNAPHHHVGLGNVQARRQDFSAAIRTYQRALDLDPANAAARNNLANSFLATGRFAEAIEAYGQVLEHRPDDQAVLRNLALAREALRSQSTGRP
jgi:protein O-mannosyl-transferase